VGAGAGAGAGYRTGQDRRRRSKARGVGGFVSLGMVYIARKCLGGEKVLPCLVNEDKRIWDMAMRRGGGGSEELLGLFGRNIYVYIYICVCVLM
jgi:hypothetical protein